MEFAETDAEPIRFCAFELKPQSGEIFRDGVAVKISPQPYRVLLFLVRNAGQLVTRKEIQEEIWGSETFVDFDKGLNLCIAQIREALGDDAQSPKYIETLPRRGYRFICEIENQHAQSQITKAEPISVESSQSSRISRKTVLASFAVLLIVIAVASLYFIWGRASGNAVEKDGKAMLLVLPIENLNGGAEQDYFSDGLTEETITLLGSLQPQRLGVIARTTALTYKKKGKDIRRIGQELNVNYVLEGSVRRENGRLRIAMQLIKVEEQSNIWSETFERDEKEILEIQREVASRVASALRLKLFPTSSSEVADGKFAKPEAFDAYLKGRYLITKDTPEDLRRSIPYFDEAIKADPQFAPAYAAQVEALVLLADWTGTIAESNLPKAKAAALKAVELDPYYAESYAALGSVQLWLEWNRVEAEENFRRAVELNPNNPLIRLNYGRCLLSRGKIGEAENEINAALKLDPVSLLTTGLAAFSYLNAGLNDKAIALSQHMLELEPKSPSAHECLFWAYVNKEDYPNVLDFLRRKENLYGANPSDIRRFDKGNPKDVIETKFRRDLNEMRGYKDKSKAWLTYAAWISVKLREKEHAIEWLEIALKERSTFMLYIAVTPNWNSLQSDPRFAAILQKVSP